MVSEKYDKIVDRHIAHINYTDVKAYDMMVPYCTLYVPTMVTYVHQHAYTYHTSTYLLFIACTSTSRTSDIKLKTLLDFTESTKSNVILTHELISKIVKLTFVSQENIGSAIPVSTVTSYYV